MCEKIHQFLSNTEKDAHKDKRKLVPFFCPTVYIFNDLCQTNYLNIYQADQSEVSFSISRGTFVGVLLLLTLPWQPILLAVFTELSFLVKFAKGRQRTVQMQLIRWMQAASGTAGRAKRWDSPCI